MVVEFAPVVRVLGREKERGEKPGGGNYLATVDGSAVGSAPGVLRAVWLIARGLSGGFQRRRRREIEEPRLGQ